jgi:hypothetical protein
MLLLQTRECGYHGACTAATTKGLCDAAAEFAAIAIRGCTSRASHGAVAGSGADFGGFEAFFYCCELSFETVRIVLVVFNVEVVYGCIETYRWLACMSFS